MPIKKRCPFCGNEIEEGEKALPYKNRCAHVTCLDEFEESLKAKMEEKAKRRKTRTKEINEPSESVSDVPTPVSEGEYADKKEVYKYIEKLTKEKPTGKDYALISKYKNDYGFTYKGMLNALIYYYEALEKQSEGSTIGVIPYVYKDAQEYMERWERAKRHNDAITPEELRRYYTPIKVVIDPTKLNMARKITDAQPDVWEFRNRRNRTIFDDIDDARAAGLPEPTKFDTLTPEEREESRDWIRRFIAGEFNKDK